MVESKCSKKLKTIGVLVIVGSGLALFGGINLFTMPPMGEMGDFAHDIFAPLILCMAAWGFATGIGVLRAGRWARISMLVFSGLLAVSGALAFVFYLFVLTRGMSGGPSVLLRIDFLLLNLIPVAIGVWWFIYFMRSDVRAFFQMSRKAPLASG
jgi:hypothetical protein